jgi:hypothetical protein
MVQEVYPLLSELSILVYSPTPRMIEAGPPPSDTPRPTNEGTERPARCADVPDEPSLPTPERAEDHHQQHRQGLDSADDQVEQFPCRRVEPVQVLHHHQDRSGPRKAASRSASSVKVAAFRCCGRHVGLGVCSGRGDRQAERQAAARPATDQRANVVRAERVGVLRKPEPNEPGLDRQGDPLPRLSLPAAR